MSLQFVTCFFLFLSFYKNCSSVSPLGWCALLLLLLLLWTDGKGLSRCFWTYQNYALFSLYTCTILQAYEYSDMYLRPIDAQCSLHTMLHTIPEEIMYSFLERTPVRSNPWLITRVTRVSFSNKLLFDSMRKQQIYMWKLVEVNFLKLFLWDMATFHNILILSYD